MPPAARRPRPPRRAPAHASGDCAPDPGGDGRAVSRRRLERPGRARPERRRSQRHPHELRRLLGHRRGRPADDQARAPGHVERLRGPGRRRRLRLALRPRRAVLALHAHRRELPARGAGGRRRRRRHVHEHLPRAATRAAGRTSTSRSTRASTAATDTANTIATSQIALPEDACSAVYATDGYGQSIGNLQQVSLETDNVFGDDGGVHQLGTVTGSVDEGYVVELAVPVATSLYFDGASLDTRPRGARIRRWPARGQGPVTNHCGSERQSGGFRHAADTEGRAPARTRSRHRPHDARVPCVRGPVVADRRAAAHARRPGRDPHRGSLRSPAAQAGDARDRSPAAAAPTTAAHGRADGGPVPRALAADHHRAPRSAHELHPPDALPRVRVPRDPHRALLRERSAALARLEGLRSPRRRHEPRRRRRDHALERHADGDRRRAQCRARGRQQHARPPGPRAREHDAAAGVDVIAAGRGLGRRHVPRRRGHT